MNYIHVLAVICAVVAASAAAPQCLNTVDMITKCVNDNGFDMAAIQKQVSSGGMDAQAYKDQCAKLPQYEKAMQCIGQEFSRCPLGHSIIPLNSLTKMSQSMFVLCNDSKVNFDCLAQVSKQQSQIQSCVMSSFGSVDFTKPQQIMCESARIGLQCSINVVKACDEYTATVFENQGKAALPC